MEYIQCLSKTPDVKNVLNAMGKVFTFGIAGFAYLEGKRHVIE